MRRFYLVFGTLLFFCVFLMTSSPVLATITCTVSVNSAIADLSAIKSREHAIDLSWTTPNIKSVQSGYIDIRCSKKGILPENWDQALRVSGEPKPIAGAFQKTKVKDLESGATYYFAMKIMGIDQMDPPLSNVAVATTMNKSSNSVSAFDKYCGAIKDKIWLSWNWW